MSKSAPPAPVAPEALRFNHIYIGDVLDMLAPLPDNSVNTALSSPPYWGVRDYGIRGQIGHEKSPMAYIKMLTRVFQEVRRVLRPDGSLWLNLGDTYINMSRKAWHIEKGNFRLREDKTHGYGVLNNAQQRVTMKGNREGLKEKDLAGIPWRVALALQQDGWYLRSDSIWCKPGAMPESVRDRPSRNHEYLFLLSGRAKNYYYNEWAAKTAAQDWGTRDRSEGKYTSGDVPIPGGAMHGLKDGNFADRGKNRRTVIECPTANYKGDHFATFPPDLIRPLLMTSVPKHVCAHCQRPYLPALLDQVEALAEGRHIIEDAGWFFYIEVPLYKTLAYYQQCKCADPATLPGSVIDPFMGAGTTGLVAQQLGLRWIGIELNPAYAAQATTRITGPMGAKPMDKKGEVQQLSLFGDSGGDDEV